MYVVGAVARHTRLRKAFPHLVDVTTLADDLDMRAAQIERRLRMIETNVGPCPIFTMAVGAFFAQSLHVRLRVAMTGDTLDRCFSERFALCMTRAAIATDMAAAQREIGSIVIEGRTIKTHDVGVATLVLGVTGFAQQLGLVFGDASMETC